MINRWVQTKLSDWRKESQRYAYEGWRSMLIKTFKLPDGRKQEYDVVENGRYVVVVALTKNQEVILVRQFRPGPEKLLASFCEGYVDRDESPATAAARELLEETGYRVGALKYLRTFQTAYSTEERICFMATDCEYVQPPKGDADEFIEVFTLGLAEFWEWVALDASNFYGLDAAHWLPKT